MFTKSIFPTILLSLSMSVFAGCSQYEVDSAFAVADTDSDGVLNAEEFTTATRVFPNPYETLLAPGTCALEFNELDSDGDNVLSVTEVDAASSTCQLQ